MDRITKSGEENYSATSGERYPAVYKLIAVKQFFDKRMWAN